MSSSEREVFIIDCQLLQTKAWHRGMGKYTARTLEAWCGSDKLMTNTPDIKLLFNSRLPYSDELKDFVEGLKRVEATFLALDVPNYEDLSSITKGQKRNQAIIDEYLNRGFPGAKVSFMITSLFLDEACPVFPTTAHKSLIYYDLIPLMYVRKYLGYGASEQFFTRFSVLYQADMVFAISETVANDLTNFLGFSADKIVNILGASNQSIETRHESKPTLPIDRPFILMPTGGDPRKNNEFGVKAFNKFNVEHDHAYQLVITSYFNDEQKKSLRSICDDIIFTDNVSDDELWWLYTHSEGVLFPSEYEGLGMPVLEAMDADKLVACSDIAVFREISEDAYFMFSPYSIDEAVEAIYSMVHADEKVCKKKKSYYKAIQERYTWENTATIIRDHMLNGQVSSQIDDESKPSIAIVAPHICGTSEAGLWATNQYLKLAENYQVDYYYEMTSWDKIVRPSTISFVTRTYNILELDQEKYDKYDAVIYIYDGADRSRLTVLAALGAPGLFLCGKNDIDVALDKLAEEGYMTRSHRSNLSAGDVVDRSIGFVDIYKHDSSFSTDVPQPPYRQSRRMSASSRITLSMDGSDRDKESALYLKTLTNEIDMSRVEVKVISRSAINETARSIIDDCPIDIAEKLTDHEYASVLMRSDLYVDCDGQESLERSLRIDTVSTLSIPVLCITENCKTTDELLAETYRWLAGGCLESEKDDLSQKDKKTLADLIKGVEGRSDRKEK
jgi:glycosyltransferase, family 1